MDESVTIPVSASAVSSEARSAFAPRDPAATGFWT